jgi:hypothetical protein
VPNLLPHYDIVIGGGFIGREGKEITCNNGGTNFILNLGIHILVHNPSGAVRPLGSREAGHLEEGEEGLHLLKLQHGPAMVEEVEQ